MNALDHDAKRARFENIMNHNTKAKQPGLKKQDRKVQATYQEGQELRQRTEEAQYQGTGAPGMALIAALLVASAITKNLEVKEVSTPAMAFGREAWIQHIGDPGEVPPLPANIEEILASPCPFWPDKIVEETHMLVLVPKTVTRIVNGAPITEPLTLRSLDKMVKSSNNNGNVGYSYIWEGILEERGDAPIERSHWILMAKQVIPGSQQKSYAEQKAIVEAKGYEIPSCLDAATAILLEYIRSGTRFFSSNYARCLENTGQGQWIVGDFNYHGLIVNLNTNDNSPNGIAAVKMF